MPVKPEWCFCRYGTQCPCNNERQRPLHSLLKQNAWAWVIYHEQKFVGSQFWRLEVQFQGANIREGPLFLKVHVQKVKGTGESEKGDLPYPFIRNRLLCEVMVPVIPD
jgi:hypothetical protein